MTEEDKVITSKYYVENNTNEIISSIQSTDYTNGIHCSICYNIITENKKTLTCGHYFCYECIHKWFKTSETCPICRKSVIIIAIITYKQMKMSFTEEPYYSDNIDSLCVLCGESCIKKSHCSSRFNMMIGYFIRNDIEILDDSDYNNIEGGYGPSIIYFCDDCSDKENVYDFERNIYFHDYGEFIADKMSIRVND
jgi:hypothetical protein